MIYCDRLKVCLSFAFTSPHTLPLPHSHIRSLAHPPLHTLPSLTSTSSHLHPLPLPHSHRLSLHTLFPHSHSLAHPPSLPLTHSHLHILPLPHSHTLTCTPSLSPTHTLSLAHAPSPSLPHILLHNLSPTHALLCTPPLTHNTFPHTHTPSRPFTQRPS